MGGMILTILIICAVFFLFGFLNDSSTRKTEKSKAERHKEIEDRHREMLATIDECPNPLVRRERKAQVETMIHSGLKEVDDINYHPSGINEVTTAEERRARRSAELAGKKYVHTLTRKQAEEIADEMFPLLTEIYNYFVDNFKIKSTTNNLQNILNDLTKNDMNFKTFLNFTQNLAVLLPASQNKNGKNIFDYFMREDLSEEEREKQFKNTVLQEKNLLLKYITPLRKYFSEDKEENNSKKQKENNEGN